MKKCKLFSAAVMGTAAVIVLAGFLTACKQGNSPGGGGNTPAPEKVTVTVTGDENVKSIKPEKLTADKGSDWKTVKTKITVKYKDGYEAAGFKLESKNGAELKDSHKFDKNTTVFAVSKPKSAPANITITVEADSGYELKTPASFEAASGAKWADIKGNAEAKVSLKEGYTALGWKLGGASGADLNGSHTFTESTIVFAVSKKNGAPVPEKITITVKGDDGVELAAENTFKADKNAEWKNIKASAMGKITVKENYEFAEWRLNGKTGELLTDTKTFAADTTVFAVTKIKECTYKVEHWQQNIADNGYTKVEADTENLTGTTGEDTAAQAKTYGGFTAKPVTQQKIKADGSTVIKVYYDRNIITLTLDLDGGAASTPLEDGEGGKKLLKGKFEASVKVKNPVKEDSTFTGWNPELPATFPAVSPTDVYKASYTYAVTIKGDERTEIPEGFCIKKTASTKWADIKAQAEENVTLKTEWQDGDYGIYEWRVDNENGEKLTDDYDITKGITVYAVTNYTKFNIEGTEIKLNSQGKGYTGGKPKGKIIIPEGITKIKNGEYSIGNSTGAFKECTEITSLRFPASLTVIGDYAFCDCTGLTSVKLPASLEEIGDYAFCDCTSLTSVNLSACTSLTWIENSAFQSCTGLTSVDLSGCTSLTWIEYNAFNDCTNATVKLPASVKGIGMSAFGKSYSSSYQTLCRRVLIKAGTDFDRIKRLVINSSFPSYRIDAYY